MRMEQSVIIPYCIYAKPDRINHRFKDKRCCSKIACSGQNTANMVLSSQQAAANNGDSMGQKVSKSVYLLSIEGSIVDAQAVSADLDLFLTSAGRSNNEINKNVWEFGYTQAQFNGFTWVTDGWIMDDDGNIAMRVQNDARLYIPFNIFGTSDFRAYGKTIEIEFAIRNVNDFYTTAISCLYNNRGFNVDVQSTILYFISLSNDWGLIILVIIRSNASIT